MKNLKLIILDYLKLIFISFIILIIYDSIIYNIFHHIYTKGTKSVLLIELLLVLMIVTIFYFNKCKNKVLKYIFPIVPILSLYILFDIFYNFLLRSPKISDFKNLLNIYNFDSIMFFKIVIFIFFIISLIFFVLLKVKKNYSYKCYKFTIIFRGIILFILLIFLQTEQFKIYHKKLFTYIVWSHENTIKKNGKISSFIFYSNLEKENEKLLKVDNNINISDLLYKENLINKKNIYYIVLESFINPNYINGLKYNINPLSDGLKKYLPNGKFSLIISPIYGGGTTQAEFELLTGVKAFAKINTSDFNVLRGQRVNAFLSRLKEYNYDTVAMISTDSSYYNSNSAYKSLGFNKVLFLEEDKSFKKNRKDKIIFDGDLFSNNIEFIKKYLKNSNKPLFNYVLGIYGHVPYTRNKEDRPDIINLENVENDSINNIANQFYYRSKELAKYINNILLLDPNSIIMVSSDHLPPILNKTIKYKYTNYTNIALLLNNGIPIDISNKNQYQIPWLIWDILSNKFIKRSMNKDILEKLYFKILSESI